MKASLYSYSAFALASVLLAGCALTSKSDPLEPRYYSPERQPVAGNVPPSTAAKPELRLGRVSAASHLRDRIVVRETDVKFSYLDEHRWSEKPDAYLRRSVQWALFEERGFTQMIAGEAPILDLELVAFERVQTANGKVARVAVHWALHDARSVVGQDTVVVERPVREVTGDDDKARDDGAAIFALATRDALAEVTAILADRIAAVVATLPPPPSEPATIVVPKTVVAPKTVVVPPPQK